MKRRTGPAWSARAALGALALCGCSTVIGLGSLERVDCIVECGGSGLSGSSGGSDSGGRANNDAGESNGIAGSAVALGGSSGDAGAPSISDAGAPDVAGSGGSGGGTPKVELCPGGPVPVETWTEHWFEHDQALSRVYYDDCVAIYFDADMAPAASTWLSPFMSKAWSYTVATYGYLGPERTYAVFHQGKYGGGHSATFREASHDFHNTVDAGGTDWTQNYQDITLTLLGFIVEGNAAHTKFGSPAAGLWGGTKWEEIYKYDVYVGLGLNDQATVAMNKFNLLSNSNPRANTFWFRDWFYPLWRDHGHAKVLVTFYSLLEQNFPAVDKEMGDMNWGEYVHFMSGAAHTNLKTLATKAFGWTTQMNDQFLQAQTDYPKITY